MPFPFLSMNAYLNKRSAVRLAIVAVVAWVFFVHLRFYRAAPDPLLLPDSEGYLSPAFDLILHGKFSLNPIRTPGYPFFLFILLKAIRWLPFVALVQHGILLATGAIVATLGRRCFGLSTLASLALGAVAVLLPRPFVLAQQCLTETLYTFVLAAIAAGVLGSMKSSRWDARRSATLGLLSMIAISIRPVGLGLFLALPAIILVAAPSKQQLKRCLLAWAAPVVLLSFVWSSINWKVFGFRGFTDFGGYSLLLDNGYLMDEHPGNGWGEFHSRDASLVFGASVPLNPALDAHYRRLVLRAIGEHPWRFMFDQASHFGWFLWQGMRRPEGSMALSLEVAQSIRRYAELSRTFSTLPGWLAWTHQPPKRAIRRVEAYRSYPFQAGDWVGKSLWPLTWLEGALPLMGFGFGLYAAYFRRSRPAIALMLLAVTHILVVNLAGSRAGRQGAPIEPIFILMVAAAFSKTEKKADAPTILDAKI